MDIDNQQAGMPGLRDFLVRLPFARTAGDGEVEHTEMRVRIPAVDAASAGELCVPIAMHVSRNNEPEPPLRQWTFNGAALTAEDVDDTPSADETLAELAHVRRVLAALAAKMPMLLQLTGAEYAAADPDDVTAVPAGDDTMIFIAAKTYPTWAAAVVAGPDAPMLLPAGDVRLPAEHGGQTDPDVRRIRAGHLAEFSALEILVGVEDPAGPWRRLESVALDDADDADGVPLVAIRFGTLCAPVTVTKDTLMVARPTTTEAYGADLRPEAAEPGRQILHDGRWWQIDDSRPGAGRLGGTYLVTVSGDGDTEKIQVGHADPVLLRHAVPGWH